MKRKKEVVIGIVVVVALASMFLGIRFLKGINFFNNNRTFYSHYENIQTLVPGSIIKWRGQQVGVVSDININKTQTGLVATFNISKSTLNIPKDSRAILLKDLLGTSSIELVLGNDLEHFLLDKDTITPDVSAGISQIVTEKIEPIEVKINRLLERLNNSLAKVDTSLGKDGENITNIMYGVKSSLKTLNSTLKNADNLIESSAGDIKLTLNNIVSITKNLKNSNQKVTNLLSNFSEISDSLKNVDIAGAVRSAKDALEGVSKIVEEINNGTGSVHQLIYNDDLVKNINAMLKESTSLIENIENHPNRYLQFAVFGAKDKGLKLNSKDEKKLKKILDNAPD